LPGSDGRWTGRKFALCTHVKKGIAERRGGDINRPTEIESGGRSAMLGWCMRERNRGSPGEECRRERGEGFWRSVKERPVRKGSESIFGGREDKEVRPDGKKKVRKTIL